MAKRPAVVEGPYQSPTCNFINWMAGTRVYRLADVCALAGGIQPVRYGTWFQRGLIPETRGEGEYFRAFTFEETLWLAAIPRIIDPWGWGPERGSSVARFLALSIRRYWIAAAREVDSAATWGRFKEGLPADTEPLDADVAMERALTAAMDVAAGKHEQEMILVTAEGKVRGCDTSVPVQSLLKDEATGFILSVPAIANQLFLPAVKILLERLDARVDELDDWEEVPAETIT